MIDDLAARMALAVAALLLLATGLSTIAPLQAAGVQEAARSLARHLARQLDAVSRTEAAVVVAGETSDLPPDLGGRPYRAEIRRGDVRIVVDGAVAAAGLLVPVYPAVPPSGDLSAGALAALSEGTVVVPGGGSFVIERLEVVVDGRSVLLTFVRLPP